MSTFSAQNVFFRTTSHSLESSLHVMLIQCVGVVHVMCSSFFLFLCADLQLFHRVSGGDCAKCQERGQVGTINK